MRRFGMWYLRASRLQRFVYTATSAGALYGLFGSLGEGWRHGLLAGIGFGVLFGVVKVFVLDSFTQRRLGQLAARADIEVDELLLLSSKLHDGAAPQTTAEAAAMRRLVAQRRRADRTFRWTGPLMAATPFVLGGVVVAGGAVSAGAVLLGISALLLVAMVVARRRESRRLDRAEQLLAFGDASATRSQPE